MLRIAIECNSCALNCSVSYGLLNGYINSSGEMVNENASMYACRTSRNYSCTLFSIGVNVLNTFWNSNLIILNQSV